MRLLFVIFFGLFIHNAHSQTTYYYDGGTSSNLSDWWSIAPGIGTNPASFSLDNTIWCFCNVTDDTFTQTISGTGTTVRIDNATITDWYVTLGTGVTLDITSTGSLTLSGPDAAVNSFKPGTLDSASTVIFGDAGSSLAAGTYGKLTITQDPTTSGTYVVQSDLRIEDPMNFGSNTITVNGDLITESNLDFSSSNITVLGDLTYTIGYFPDLNFNNSTVNISGDLYSAQDVDFGTSTVDVTGGYYSYDEEGLFAFSVDFGTSDLTLGGEMVWNTGNATFYMGSGTIDIAGDWTIGNVYEIEWEEANISIGGNLDDNGTGTFIAFGTAPEITFDGSTNTTFSSVNDGWDYFPKIIVDKSTGSLTMQDNVDLVKGLVINSGELNIGTTTLELLTLGAALNAGEIAVPSGGTLTLTSVGLNNTGGTLNIESGGTVTLGSTYTTGATTTLSGTLTTTGAMTQSSSGTFTQTGGTWNANGTVNNSGTITLQTAASSIFATTFTNESAGTLNVAASDADFSGALTNNATAIVNLTSNGVIEALGNVTNHGTINVAHATSFIQGASSALSGSGTFEVSLTSPTQWTNYFSYFSTPITSATIGWGGDVEGDAMYSFRKGGEGNPDWTYIGAAQAMNPGEGYATLDGNHVVFSGTANNGDVAISINRNTGESVNHVWNLVGNPYPSPINATDLIDGNTDMGGAIYVWDQAANSGTIDHSGYAVINNVGTVGSSNYYTDSLTATDYWIATGQGFMVESLVDNGTVTFKNAFRLDDKGSHNNTSLKDGGRDMTRFRIRADQNGNVSTALLAFDETATPGYDRLFDAKAMEGSNISNNFMHPELNELAIQGLPYPEASLVIPMRFQGERNDLVRLSISELDEALTGYTFYFVDSVAQIKAPLENDYYFSPSSKDYHYYIVLENPDYEVVGFSDLTSENNLDYSWTKRNGNWTVESTQSSGKGKVSFFDLSGRLIMETPFEVGQSPAIETEGHGILIFESDQGHRISQKI